MICQPPFVDGLRRKVEPAWTGGDMTGFAYFGGQTPVDEVVSAALSYGMAAFARLVAEAEPKAAPAQLLHGSSVPRDEQALHGGGVVAGVQAQYGADAMKFANAAMETMGVFLPQFDAWPGKDGAVNGTFRFLRQFPTAVQCELAEKHAKEHVIRFSKPTDIEGLAAAIDDAKRHCDKLGNYAGKPWSHNYSLASLMGLIELWRVLDSKFYRNSPARVSGADFTHGLIPILVTRGQRYFVNNLELVDTARYRWLYGNDVPDEGDPDWENTSHGNLDMLYLNVLWQNLPRLRAKVPSGEPILLDVAMRHHFANTFLQAIAPPDEIDRGGNFRGNVDGARPDSSRRDDGFNHTWDGWIYFADADATVYRMCRDVGLRTDDTGHSQPYLTIANHSALLANKRWMKTATPAPAECRVGSKCCEYAPDGSCSKCLPQRMQCP